jgi:hypothetical protein
MKLNLADFQANHHNNEIYSTVQLDFDGHIDKFVGVHKPAFPPVRESDLAIIPE